MFKQFSLFLCFAVLLLACGPEAKKEQTKVARPDVLFADYQELADPQPVDTAAWEALGEPLYAAFGSSNVRYPKHVVPGEKGTKRQVKAWKGEKLNLQVVLWATEDISQLSIQTSDLVAEGREGIIPASAIKAGFVRYVMTDEFAGGCGHRKPAEFDSSLVADVIDVIPTIDIPAKSVRPVWVSIKIPREAATGTYKGELLIQNSSGVEVEPLSLELQVQDHSLPPASKWAYHLDLWQNPYAEARVHKVEKWSEAHFEAMRPSMKMLADAGQKIITASIIHDPWNSQTYDIYDSMIRWIKKEDGSWEYDYSIFDQWVEYMSGLGIDQQINCYSMVPWNLKFYYYDEKASKDTVLIAEPGSPEFDAHWRPMLEDFARHLKEKGWFEKTTIAMDERPLEAMQAVIKLVKSVDENFKISLAGWYHSEIEDDIYDYCIASGEKMSADTLALRANAGKRTTFYTCCVEAYPNTFTFSPPAESTWLSWHAAAKGYDGYLRWAYNCWVKDPLRDTRFRTWPAGDTYLVYPGARSSIRFEKMIDGIEDYEKIRVLREEFTQNGDSTSLQQLQSLLEPFNDIPQLDSVSAADMLEKGEAGLSRF